MTGKREGNLMSAEKKHSRLGASTAKRWLNCSKSPSLIDQAPPAQSSVYAGEGTRAHEWLEYVLRKELLGEKVKSPKKPDRDMENHVQTAVNWVQENYMPELGDILQVETKVSLAWIHPEMFGTLDIAIVREGGVLTIADFKYGQGHVVEPEKNEQLLYYALGVAKLFDFNFEEIEIVVIQPRAQHDKGPIRSWKCSVAELKSWESLFKKGADRIDSPKARLFAGEHCMFCPAIPICPEIKKAAVETAKSVFSDEPDILNLPALPDPKDLSPEVIGKILNAADSLEHWVKGVWAYAEGLISRGGKIEGYKLVMKRPRRQWTDEKNAAETYFELAGLNAFDLKSPTQIEKLGVNVDDECVSVSSGTTIVKASDKRAAVDLIREVFDQPIQGELNGKEENKKEGGKKEGRKKGKTKTIEKSFLDSDDFGTESSGLEYNDGLGF